MEQQKQISDYTDTELQEIRASALKGIIEFQARLNQAQQNVQAVEAELEKRKPQDSPKKDEQRKAK